MRPSEAGGASGADHARAKLRKLARMANQIATFFRSYPEEEAVAGVQDHIVTSWPPRMRADLGAAIEDTDLGLDPLVRSAFRRMARAASPTQRASAGPETVGELGSDAG
jgi:formate dehydrogenase subunit delta